MPTISKLGATLPASPIRRLHHYAVDAVARGLRIHYLNIGQPDMPTSTTMSAAYRAFNDDVVGYSPSHGTPELRQAWVDYYNHKVLDASILPLTEQDVMVTVGGSEALFFALASVCDPGDEVLVAEPFYTNYRAYIHLLGLKLVVIPTREEEDFALSAKRVRAACTHRTRALLINNPNNPTGAVLGAQELVELGEVCRQQDIFLISDEVYREFVFDDREMAPSTLSLPGLEQHVIVLDSVSKRYSACGARIGCLVTRNRDVYAASLCLAQARLSPPIVDQTAAVAALLTPAEETRAVVDEYRRRRDAAVEGLSVIEGVSCSIPAGAFYLIANLPVENAEDFCIFLLQNFDLNGETVMLAPAEGFYVTEGMGHTQVRLACVVEVSLMRRATEIIAAALKVYGRRGRVGEEREIQSSSSMESLPVG